MFVFLSWSRFAPSKSIVSGPANHYQATDIAPFFEVRRPCLSGGWYVLDACLQHDAGQLPARLLIDYGEGYEEGAEFTLALPAGVRVKRICYFERAPRALRFVPMDATGEFSVKHFRLIRVPFFLVKPVILRWLSTHQAEFMSKSLGEINTLILAKARQLGVKPVALLRRYYAGGLGALRRRRRYAEWVKQNTPEPERLTEQLQTLLKQVPAPVTFSVLVPVYNPPVELLRACIESVLQQVYPYWQLCLADDASSDPQVRVCLREYAQRDNRIQVIEREQNGHIVAASNSALSLAQGGYIALLDHDDALAPHALLRVAEALRDNPQARLVYSDEDKLDSKGRRVHPHFKPDWNPDLLLGQNYICHLTVLSAALVQQVGGFRPGTEGSQDHDLLLRCMPYLSAETVVHIADVLYHWRMIEGSTASAASEKSYTEVAGIKAVQDYLAEHQPGAKTVEGQVPNSYRVLWPLPDPAPKVSLLVPTRDGVHILKPCVDAILQRTDYPNFELLILDNQSTCPETLAFFQRVSTDPRVQVHRWDHPFNFSAINNFGASLATGSIIGLINNDVEPMHPEWLREMVSQVSRPDIGCVGAKLYYPNNTLQHAGVILGIGGVAGHSHKYFPKDNPGYFSRLTLVQNLSAVTGACLLVRKAVYDQVGGLDDQHLAVAFNDVDFCLKIRQAGYRNLWTPYAELYHHESVSRGAEDTQEKRERFLREIRTMRERWGSELDADPAYNPNLSRTREDFSLGDDY